MLDLNDVLKKKSCVSKIVSGYPVMLVYLYGSLARGQATPLSDLDIAVVVDPDYSADLQRLQLELEIEDQLVGECGLEHAEVRVINDAPIIIRGEVLTEGVLLYSRDDDFRVDFEVRNRMEYFDFLPIAKQLAQEHFAFIREGGSSGYGQ